MAELKNWMNQLLLLVTIWENTTRRNGMSWWGELLTISMVNLTKILSAKWLILKKNDHIRLYIEKIDGISLMFGFFIVASWHWGVYLFLSGCWTQLFVAAVVKTLDATGGVRLETWFIGIGVKMRNLYFLLLFGWTFLALFSWSQNVDGFIGRYSWILLFFSGRPSLYIDRKRSKFHDIFFILTKNLINFKAGHSPFRINLNQIHNNIFELLTILNIFLNSLWIKNILEPKISSFIKFEHINLINKIMITFCKIL